MLYSKIFSSPHSPPCSARERKARKWSIMFWSICGHFEFSCLAPSGESEKKSFFIQYSRAYIKTSKKLIQQFDIGWFRNDFSMLLSPHLKIILWGGGRGQFGCENICCYQLLGNWKILDLSMTWKSVVWNNFTTAYCTWVRSCSDQLILLPFSLVHNITMDSITHNRLHEHTQLIFHRITVWLPLSTSPRAPLEKFAIKAFIPPHISCFKPGWWLWSGIFNGLSAHREPSRCYRNSVHKSFKCERDRKKMWVAIRLQKWVKLCIVIHCHDRRREMLGRAERAYNDLPTLHTSQFT